LETIIQNWQQLQNWITRQKFSLNGLGYTNNPSKLEELAPLYVGMSDKNK